MRQQLSSFQWTLRAVGGDLADVPESIRGKNIPATIPGAVHTDLMAAGLIEDPYYNRNELKVEWIGRVDWVYSCEFEADANLFKEERITLACEGLDTIARLELNGQPIGESFDMHVPCRFEIKNHLKAGRNQLSITFASALKFAQAMEAKMGTLPCAYKQPFNFIRKMACNFGWDWGPILITAGVWQPIYIEGWSGARIQAVRPLIKEVSAEQAVVDVCVDVETSGDLTTLPAQIILRSPDGKLFSSNGNFTLSQSVGTPSSTLKTLSATITVPKPERWWPRGHGAQPLYTLEVGILCATGAVASQTCRSTGGQGGRSAAKTSATQNSERNWQVRIGLRTVRLNTDKDEIGSKFTLEVNGKPIFCKGANWIPDDCFPHRVTRTRYAERLKQACDSNMNMLRVWGGGIFENEDFYSLCDEMGLMVWQDFLFACAAYPEESPFAELVAAEAKYHVARLSSHASLVLWNGNNENIWGYWSWGWKEKIGTRTWGFGFYDKLLPKIVAEVDPSRPYWPGSPYSGSLEIDPLDDRYGNKHIWDAWNNCDYAVYRQYTPRFVSEFGHQAPATYATTREAIPSAELSADSPAMLHHQKATNGNTKLHDRLQEHFNLPEKFDDWLYVTQLNQARAMQYGVEWFRSREPICMGALYWQINDCWPVTSWAAVDGYGRKKPLWYATRRFYNDRLLTFQPEKDGSVKLFIINDSDEIWQSRVGELSLRRFNFVTGTSSSPMAITLHVPQRSVQTISIAAALSKPVDPSQECLVAQLGQGGDMQAFWFFDVDKNLKYPEAKYEATLQTQGDEYTLTIKAKTFLRDVALFVDRLDPAAEVSDQLVTILPGQSVNFSFRSQRQLSLAAVSTYPVFQCANRFSNAG